MAKKKKKEMAVGWGVRISPRCAQADPKHLASPKNENEYCITLKVYSGLKKIILKVYIIYRTGLYIQVDYTL